MYAGRKLFAGCMHVYRVHVLCTTHPNEDLIVRGYHCDRAAASTFVVPRLPADKTVRLELVYKHRHHPGVDSPEATLQMSQEGMTIQDCGSQHLRLNGTTTTRRKRENAHHSPCLAVHHGIKHNDTARVGRLCVCLHPASMQGGKHGLCVPMGNRLPSDPGT